MARAIDGLPREFAEKLDNVEFILEDEPTAEDWGEREIPRGAELLGLYRGVPLTERSTFAPDMMPDEITIFQGPIERRCRTRQDIVREIRLTVLHEIAHHFGIADDRLRELGY